MVLVVPDSADVLMLKFILNNITTTGSAPVSGGDRRLRLFTNDIIPYKSTILGDLVEASNTGYAAIPLVGTSWVVSTTDAPHIISCGNLQRTSHLVQNEVSNVDVGAVEPLPETYYSVYTHSDNIPILEGTISGTVYSASVAIQTFVVSCAGVFTFTDIGSPAVKCETSGSSVNNVTGVITLAWIGMPAANYITFNYEYDACHKKTTASYSIQTFSMTQAANIYGYYITNVDGTQLLWAERFPHAPFIIPNWGGNITVTLNFTLD